MTTDYELLFFLLQAALNNDFPRLSPTSPDWPAIYKLSSKQGVLAIAWDGLERLIEDDLLPEDLRPSLQLKLEWGFNVKEIERRYENQKNVIGKLARFYAGHGIETMILKGYGLSLCYPIPNHRPCGDIDIWLFGKQKQADQTMYSEKGIVIHKDKHHHTTFVLDGILVENHYNFFNIHSHHSNRDLEQQLELLSRQEPQETVSIEGHTIILPSPDFNALFLLRHAAVHFAAAQISLRHVIDWILFVRKYSDRIDWRQLERIAHEQNMHQFLHALNAIVIDLFGLDPKFIPVTERNETLERQILNEILHPQYLNNRSTILWKNLSLRLQRWWANRWKHRITYRESLLKTFFIQIWSHLLKPHSFK